MSWFEQGTSNARCTITQFHRPAELKLKRILAACLLPYVLEHTGIFVLEGGGAPWITVEAACSSQNDGSGISAGVFASSGLFSMPFGPSFFCGKLLQTMVFFCPFPDNSAL